MDTLIATPRCLTKTAQLPIRAVGFIAPLDMLLSVHGKVHIMSVLFFFLKNKCHMGENRICHVEHLATCLLIYYYYYLKTMVDTILFILVFVAQINKKYLYPKAAAHR